MIQLPMTYQSCDYNVCGSCSKLKVKCLEKRWFGGLDFGKCAIRSHKEMARWPSHPKHETLVSQVNELEQK